MKIEKMLEQYAESKRKFLTEAQGAFKEFIKEFFDMNPEIRVIKWSQYTPYFNDGDSCIFNVHEPTFSNSEPDNVTCWGELEEERDREFAFQGEWSIPTHLEHKEDVFEDFTRVICSSEMKDVLHGMFGDHVCVTCTSEGIDVEEYEHD